MKPLRKPAIDTESVFNDCNTFQDINMSLLLGQSLPYILAASVDFEQKAQMHETYKINAHDTVNGLATKQDMIKLYEQKLVNKKSQGRKYYDQLLSIPPNNICPLCGVRVVATLDHYMPKSNYPALAITPSNLIASCRDCNSDKLSFSFTRPEDETLHPYYDDISHREWLYASIVKDQPIAFKFYINKDSANQLLSERIETHFRILKLGKLYSIKAAEHLSGITAMLCRLYVKSGQSSVYDQIQEDYLSWKNASINSWQAAFYRSICESDWFFAVWLPKQLEIMKAS